MKRIQWIGEIENERIYLKSQGYTGTEIAKILSNKFNHKITKDMVYGREKVVKNKLNKLNLNQTVSSLNIDNSKMFDNELYDTKDKYIASEQTKKDMKDIWELFNTKGSKKIFNISDLHAPYINFEKLEIAINQNLDCDICVLNGDIFDGESMSCFEKMDELDSSEEFNQVRKVLDVLSNKFKHVIWVNGNHDGGRFKRYIIKNIKSTLRKYAYDRLNPITYLCENYSNIIAVNHNTVQIGDIVFKHPNKYSGVEMKTVVNESDILYANRNNLPNPNFRAVIIGHTHDLGCYYRNGILLGESGCVCYTPDYRFTEPTKRRWTTGYVRIELDENNKIIFNKSKFISLDD